MVNKTKMVKKEKARHDWYVVNAKDKVLGRLASKIAVMLSGKDRPDWTPNVDSGAGVIVTNCDKVKVTGKKNEQKNYTSYSGYPGGLKTVAYKEMMQKKPAYILRHAVRGMLPKSRLGERMLKRLKLYTGEEYPHSSQQPKKIDI